MKINSEKQKYFIEMMLHCIKENNKRKYSMQYWIGWLGILMILQSCSSIVGGVCKYEEITGMAKVISISKEECIVDFYPDQNRWPEWNIRYNIHHIDATCIGKVVERKYYPAVYKEETEGSCKPYHVIVGSLELLKQHGFLSKKYHQDTL